MGTTETRETTATKLARIAKLSASDRFKRFDSLMHLFKEARSRSDAPGFIEWSGECESVIRSALFSIGVSISVDSSVGVAAEQSRSAKSSHSAVWNRLDPG